MKIVETTPSTLKEAVEIILSTLTEEEKQVIRTTSSYEHHHTVGRYIRNTWGLWQDSALAQHFKIVYGLGHADDMSAIILADLWARILDIGFDPNIKAQACHAHWQGMGINPLTQESVKDNV